MELEIKVMWCRGLTAFNFFQKLSTYAAASLTSDDDRIELTSDQKQEQKTPVDEDNEGSPEWNYPMKFDLQSLNFVDPVLDDLSLLFEFRITGQLFGDKTIGEVRVPVKDLIQSGGGEVDRFVSYEVRNPEGKHNGIFDFSYKVIGDANTIVASNNDVSITGYQHHDRHQQKLDQSHENSTDVDVNVNGYYHQHQHQQFDSHTQSTNSDIHMTGYHHHHHHSNGSALSSETDRIQYPNIEFGDNHSSVVSAPSLVYPPPSSFSSLTATTDAHYQLSAPDIYPPPAPPQTWVPPPQPHYPPPSHYPSPPPPRPYVYPPPASQPQPYGNSHWGYHRPPGYHHPW